MGSFENRFSLSDEEWEEQGYVDTLQDFLDREINFDSLKAKYGRVASIEEVLEEIRVAISENGNPEEISALARFKGSSELRDCLLDMGFIPHERIKEGEEDKDAMMKAVETMDLSVIMEDRSATQSFDSFKAAVGRYLADQDLLEGTWVDDWNAEDFRNQAMSIAESGEEKVSMFSKLYGVVQERFKEAQEVQNQEKSLESRFSKFLDPNDADSFLSDDYLKRHSIEKKLAKGEYANNDGKGLMMRVFKDEKVDPKIQDYLAGRMGEKFRNFCKDLQEAYDQRLEAKQKEFDVLFDQVFSGVSIDQYDPNEIADLKQMIYTSAKNSRSINELNEWYDDDKTRFIKYRKCVDMRVQDEKEMWEDIKEIGDFQLGYEHDQLRARYQQERKQWSGGTYYSPGDQWMYVKDMKAKVKMRRQQMERENNSMQSSLESRFEGGAFDWGDNEKLGKRMQQYLGGLLEKAPTLVEKEQLLRGLESRFPTLQSQLQAMHGLWEGMEKEVGKDNIDPKFLSQRDTLWKSMLGQIMPREKTAFAPDRWNISEQLSGLRKLVGEIRADRVKTLDEEQKQKDVEEKIKKGDISELPVDDERLTKSDKFNEILLKSWGYTKSQFATAAGGDEKSKSTLKKLHTQWQESHEKHWEGVVSEQASRFNRKVDALPGAYAAVGKFFIDGMKKQAGPDKPTKKRHEWFLKNEPAILDTINGMDRYVREYDTLMTPEFRTFVHNDQPQLGQKLNAVWDELTGRVSNGEFGKLGSSLGGYDNKTKTLYQQAQKAYEKHLKDKELEEQEAQEQQEQEVADKKLEAAFKTGQSALDTRFNFFLRRHQSVKAQQSGGATTGDPAMGFKNEAEFKKAVLGGLTGLDVYEDKEYFDTWVSEKFKALQEGELEEEGDIFATIKSLDKRTETTRKAFEDAGYPIDDMRQLELLDKYNIRPDYLGRTGLNIDQLTRGLERVERLSAESGKVGYIDQMLKENSLNSTGVFGTMVIGMLSVMNPNDFDTWKSDLRKMEFKMGKPGREDAVLLMNSLFTHDRLMSQVNKDLSDLKSKFCSEGLKLINVDLKDILEDKEAATLAEILEEIEKAEQEREPDTPIEEVEGYFNLAGAEISEREAVMAQLAAYRFDPGVSSRGLSAQYLDQGLERIAILEQVQAFTPLDKVLREGTQNGYLSNHLFESLAVISEAEFKQWETQVRGMNLSGMSDEEKSYAMLQLLFDQGTLDRIARLESGETTEPLSDGATDQLNDEEMEEGIEAEALVMEGEEVDVGHTIDLEGEDSAATTQGDDSQVSVDEEEGGATEPLNDGTTEEKNAEMTDEAIDAQADEGDELLEMEESLTDEAIDAQADEGDELLDQELETEEDEEEIPEEELVGVLEVSQVESVEGGEDLGAQSVAESQEIDGLGDNEDEEFTDVLKDEEIDASLEGEVFEDEVLQEELYATADDFSDEEEDEEGEASMEDGEDREESDVEADLGDELLEGDEVEALSQEEIDALVGEGEILLEGEEDPEVEGEPEMTDEEIDAQAEEGDEWLKEEEGEVGMEDGEMEEEELEQIETEQEELEEQERLEAEEEEQAEQEQLEAEEAEQAELEEQELLEAEEAEQEELERLEAEEAEEAEQAELEEQEQLEAEEEVLEAEEEEQARIEEEEAEQEELERLEAEEAEEAEQAELEEQEALEAQEQIEAAEAEAELQESLDQEITLEEQTELVAEIRTWLETDGWQLGVEGLDQAGQKLEQGEILEVQEQEKLETAFDAVQDASDQQKEEIAAEALEAEEQERFETEEAEQEASDAEALEAEEEEAATAEALKEEQEAERQAEVERMLAEFVELMVGEKEKAEMDRQKEEAEKEERKEQVLDLIADSARTDRSMEVGGGLDLDGVLDVFREDVADFGQNRLVKKIYHSKDVMQKARGMLEYFLTQDMYRQLLKLNMRSTSMLSEDGWHFFAELYGDVYVARNMTMQEILRRFYHYVSLLEEEDVNLQISVSKALLGATVENAESVYRQLVGFYHMHKKQSALNTLKFENEGAILRAEMQFGVSAFVTTITAKL